jgi:hypothetical protein
MGAENAILLPHVDIYVHESEVIVLEILSLVN